jgi:hypothetical protein
VYSRVCVRGFVCAGVGVCVYVWTVWGEGEREIRREDPHPPPPPFGDVNF